MIDFSIIIPHKNTPEELVRCLNSIPENWCEIIIVDDNSDHKIVDFKSFPGMNRNDTSIIFTKEGLGAGYARNIGIDNAKGKWILFADADDLFVDGAFDIFDEYKNSEADVIYFNAKAVLSDDINIRSNRIDYYQHFIQDKDKNIVRYMANFPWGKLIKRKVITKNDLRFDETRVANDAYFSCYLGIVALSTYVDQRLVYICTESSNSLKMRSQTKEDRITRFNVTMKCNKLLKANGLIKYCTAPTMWYFKSRRVSDWLSINYLVTYISFFKVKAFTQAYWFLKYNI